MSVDIAQTLVDAVLPIGVTLVAGTIGLRRFEAMERSIADLRTELRDEIHESFAELRAEIHESFAELRAEIHESFAELRAEMGRAHRTVIAAATDERACHLVRLASRTSSPQRRRRGSCR